MKKITLLFVIVSAFTGCKKWLDVQPSDQIVDTELYSESTGFRNSLNGIYTQAASQNLYGCNLSWGLNSSFSQEYVLGRVGKERHLVEEFNQDHFDSRDIIDKIWSVGYNTIANCNKLLKEIEALPDSKFEFGRAERNLIIGESMAMRALIHFELLRLYAPSPAQDINGKYIPYVNIYPAKLNPPVASSEVIAQIAKDLQAAQSLVAESDTIVNVVGLNGKLNTMLSGMGSAVPGGVFFSFRMHRLNYVAIHGLLARIYLYAGNNAKAMEHAKYVYDNYGPQGRLPWWEFTPEYATTGNYKYQKFAHDILVGMSDKNLIANMVLSKQPNYRLSTDVNQWFPVSDRDFRLNLIKEVETDIITEKGKISEKWEESRTISTDLNMQNIIVPVLRLSEVYYIYSETLFKDGQVIKALEVLNQVRNARGKMTIFSQTDETAFYNELLDEYRREFLTEGQTFFAYKRLRRNLMRGTQVIPMDSRFTLPIPQKEQIF